MGSIFVLPPPYSNPQRLNAQTAAVDGEVVLFRLDDFDREEPSVQRTVQSLRRANPGSPLALWLPAVPEEAHLYFVARSFRWGIRAVCLGPTPRTESLRSQLTDVAHLADDMVAYISAGGGRATVAVELLLQMLVGSGDRRPPGWRAPEAGGGSPRTLRRHCQLNRVPAPRVWLQMARRLRAAVALQREPTARIAEIAHQHSYPDAATLSRSLFQSFARRPSQVRRMLGWEPLFWHWLRAHRVYVWPTAT